MSIPWEALARSSLLAQISGMTHCALLGVALCTNTDCSVRNCDLCGAACGVLEPLGGGRVGAHAQGNSTQAVPRFLRMRRWSHLLGEANHY